MDHALRQMLLTGGLPTFIENGTEVDTSGHIIGTGSGLVFNGGTSNWGETLFYLTAAQTRVAGLAGVIAVSVQATNTKFVVGWRENAAPTYYGVQFHSDGKLYLLNDQAPDAPGLEVGTYGVADYEIMPVCRANGVSLYIKGGAYTNWTLLYYTLTGNDATLYLAVESYDAAFTVSNIEVIANQSFVTLASDSFNRATLTTTDGAGHPEGGSGSGLTWVNQNSCTWGITSNKARITALDADSVAHCTVDVGQANIIMSGKLETTGGLIGFTARLVDTSNCIRFRITTAALTVVKVVGGSSTTVINVAITYSAGARGVFVVDGSAVRAYYNEALIGTGTIADAALQSSTLHGMFGNSVGSVVNVDDLTIRARA